MSSSSDQGLVFGQAYLPKSLERRPPGFFVVAEDWGCLGALRTESWNLMGWLFQAVGTSVDVFM
jgi:hypothetical protein